VRLDETESGKGRFVNFSLEYFDRISVFGRSTLFLALILVLNIAFTSIHVWQEWKGKKWPLYRVFGAIVGFWFPRPIGFALFTLGLAVLQWALGIVAYSGYLPLLGMVPTSIAVGALGATLGARVGDSIISHWTLALAGYLPNPGLSSTCVVCV